MPRQSDQPEEHGPALPFDLVAERSVIGSMMLYPNGAEVALAILTPSDFYHPMHSAMFDSIDSLHRRGEPFDPLLLATEMERRKFDRKQAGIDITLMVSEAPASRNIARYCGLVTDAASRRKLVVFGIELANSARENEAPAPELLQRAREQLEEVDVETTTFLPEGLSTLDDFLERPFEEKAPWVVPGMMRRNWRVIVVGGEGAGKSVLLRQIAISAAAGLHPLTHRECTPVRTLVVDLENPDEAVEDVCAPMKEAAEGRVDWEADRCWLWRKPGGIDLRRRRDRVELESVLRASKPDLVCLGPVYKCFVSRNKDEEESATAEVQHVLDDLRVRYQFGLLLEHHAPHGQEGRRRVIRPHGSVRWQRWPELGIAMLPVKDREGSYDLGRFRGDRLLSQWPDRLDRSGSAWPWEGVFPAGTFDPTRPEEMTPEF